MKTETQWMFEGRPYEPSKGVIGFIYKITDTKDGRVYIGKKALVNKKTKPPLAGKKRKRRRTCESDWRTYKSSSDEIKRIINEGRECDLYFQVVSECFTKMMLTFGEQSRIWTAAHFGENLINENIGGKFYIKKIYADEAKAMQLAMKPE